VERLTGDGVIALGSDRLAQPCGGADPAVVHADHHRAERLAVGVDGEDRLAQHAERERDDGVGAQRLVRRHRRDRRFHGEADLGDVVLDAPRGGPTQGQPSSLPGQLAPGGVIGGDADAAGAEVDAEDAHFTAPARPLTR
jgi:hypothetical protein